MPSAASIRYMDLKFFFFAASAITTICCASLHALLKSAYRSECIDGLFASSGSVVRPTAIACIGTSGVLMLANAVVAFKSRSIGAWAVAAAIFSKWQPLYFMAVTAQRFILRVIVISAVDICPLNAAIEIHIGAATIMWDCAIFLTGVMAMTSDMEAHLSPAKRRCQYFVLALCLCVDAVISYISGNVMASQLSVSVGFYDLFLDNQITSNITSQVIISLHFLFVSCRSRSGRGWLYASLRFELDECGSASLYGLSILSLNAKDHGLKDRGAATLSTTMTTPSEENEMVEKQKAVPNLSAFLRFRQRIRQFQQRHLSRCRAFVIPCVANNDVGRFGAVTFVMARPAFDWRLLRPLQQLADAHPKFYFSFILFGFSAPAIAVEAILPDNLEKGITLISMNSCMAAMVLGYLSSRRYGLDRVAFKFVVLSFRFATCVVLVAGWLVLNIRRSQQGVSASSGVEYHPTRAAANAILSLFCFLGCSLIDCSPHTPASIQICISVTACASCAVVWSLQLIISHFICR
jgi:hypothetical protein